MSASVIKSEALEIVVVFLIRTVLFSALEASGGVTFKELYVLSFLVSRTFCSPSVNEDGSVSSTCSFGGCVDVDVEVCMTGGVC
jgi:hypothetical protein